MRLPTAIILKYNISNFINNLLPIRHYIRYTVTSYFMCRVSPILFHITLLVGITSANVLSAAPPRKPTASQFNILVSRSPFTIKAASDGSQPLSPLEKDWMLGSIRPNVTGGGWSVTLIHKKQRQDRIRFVPGFSPSGFELLEVKQDTAEPMQSRVKVRQGAQEAWIGYDEALIKIRSKSPQKQVSNKIIKPVPGRSTVTPVAPVKAKTTGGVVRPTGGVVRPIRPRYTPKVTTP